MENEVWKDIIGYENKYQVSSLGRVKSLYFKMSKSKDKLNEVILKQSIQKGYYYIGLSINDFKKMFLVHRLVALSFIPNHNNKKEVNHIDGNKSNNYISNLEWVTPSENCFHANRIGLTNTSNNHYKTNHPDKGKFGKDSKKAKAVNQYSLDGEFIKKWYSMVDIKRELGISDSNIGTCCRGKRNHVGGFIWKFV